MKAILLTILLFINILVFSQNNKYKQIDTLSIYVYKITAKDSLFIMGSRGQDSLLTDAYVFIRFFDKNILWFSESIDSFPQKEYIKKEDWCYKGKYRIKKNGMLSIKYINFDEPHPFKRKYYLMEINEQGVIVENFSYAGLFRIWRKVKQIDKRLYKRYLISQLK